MSEVKSAYTGYSDLDARLVVIYSQKSEIEKLIKEQGKALLLL